MKNELKTVVAGNIDRRPIAIVGIGCRFPGGVTDPQSMWQMLMNGTDAIGPVPKDRWDAEAFYDPDYRTRGKIHIKEGGFIDRIDEFDAQFFSVAPVEARSMDPAHRLLLEHTWMAFEDAGISPASLEGEPVGVFVGTSASEYAGILQNYSERATIGPHTNTGSSPAIAANRISYVFNFTGPSFAVDTACSASMVAAHLACRSLWGGESCAAIVAGVNLIIKPELHIGFSTAGFLSPDARSKAFDARANGYVRSEGVGVLILKPLDQAVRDGNRIYAQIVGSAINEDGRTGGIALPNPEAQVKVMEAAYRDAGIDPACVGYVEAHGTGTAAGDPLECSSIGRVIGSRRTESVLIGSVKTNIGHTELASGTAGLIKAALSVHHGMVPPNVHFQTPNPRIDFAGLHLQVPTSPVPIPAVNGVVTAGVNSFGFGGANAHLVLQSSRTETVLFESGKEPLPLLLSGRSESAVQSLASRYGELLRRDESPFAQVAAAAALTRTHFDVRTAVVSVDSDGALAGLESAAAGEVNPSVVHGRAFLPANSRVAFVYSGQGGQWYAMGRELLSHSAVFRETVESVQKVLSALGWLGGAPDALIHQMMKGESETRMNETEVAQPALFALQVGVTRVWESMGLVPDAVVGHSIGEVAAACVSGALTLEEGAKLVYWRSRCQAKAAGLGKMLAVGLSAADAAEAVRPFSGSIDVAAINGPAMVTLAGLETDLQTLAAQLKDRGVFQKFLIVDVPFHCHLLDDVAREFVAQTGGIQSSLSQLPLYSTVTAEKGDGTDLDAIYWASNIRQPVLFYPAIQKMVSDGYNVFIEVGPHPIISHGIEAAIGAAKVKGLVVPSLRRGEGEGSRLALSLGQLYVAGLSINLGRLFRDIPIRGVQLPYYPFERSVYWLESDAARGARQGTRPFAHPHLRAGVLSAAEPRTMLFDVSLDPRTDPWIGDHHVQGPLVFPGAGHVDLAIGAGRAAFGEAFGFIEDIEFLSPLFLNDNAEPPQIQLQVDLDDGYFSLASRDGAKSPWSVRSRGRLNRFGDSFHSTPVTLGMIRAHVNEPVPVQPLFELLERGGLSLGATFRGIESLTRRDNEALGLIRVHPSIAHSLRRYNVHPALLDASFQSAFGIIENRAEMGVYIPRRIGRVRWHRAPSGEHLYSYARASGADQETLKVDIWVLGENGELIAEIQGFEGRYLKGSRGESAAADEERFYRYELSRAERPEVILSRRPGTWIPGDSEIRSALETALQEEKTDPAWRRFFDELCPAMDTLALAVSLDALRYLGVEVRSGGWIRRADPAFSAVVPGQRRLLDRLMTHLVSHGVLKDGTDGWTVTREADSLISKAILDRADTDLAAFRREISFFAAPGAALGAVLKGDANPVEVLFSDERIDALADYYSNAHTTAKTNRLAAAAIARIVENLPADATLRVLEIGAGTGGITSAVLPVLPTDRTEFVFTDVSSVFLSRARARFVAYPFVKYELLDVESEPDAWNQLLHSFDIVIASNVIHATRSLDETLMRVRSLLAPGGLFLLSEVTRAPLYLDLSFGMVDGWWAFEDKDRRPDHCTLDTPSWQRALFENQFFGNLAFTDVPDDTGGVAQTLFFSRVDGTVQPAAKTEAAADHALWLIYDNRRSEVLKIGAALESSGSWCVVAVSGSRFLQRPDGSFEVNPDNPEPLFDHLLSLAAEKGIPFGGMVFTAGLDAPDAAALASPALLQYSAGTAAELVSLSRAMNRLSLPGPVSIWILTPDESSSGEYLSASSLVGLSRVMSNEFDKLQVRQVALAPVLFAEDVHALVLEMTGAPPALREDELVFRNGRRLRRELIRVTPGVREAESTREILARGAPVVLERSGNGLIADARFRPLMPVQPGEDEVSIEIHAAGLNFRDVMVMTGALSDEALSGGLFGCSPGLDCAGVVMSVGRCVNHVVPGDRVMAVAARCIAGVTVAHGAFVRRIPAGLEMHIASAMPMAVLTAWHSLSVLANVRSGDRVLIHAAAGAVGHAAIHIAKTLGALVYATTSPAKMDAVRAMGVEAVFNSRDLRWYDQLMTATGGSGVDVVLNSLAGAQITQGLRALAPMGRFIELGKADLYSERRIGLRSLRDNNAWITLDIDRLLLAAPSIMSRSIDEAMGFMDRHGWPKLPVEVMPVARAAEGISRLSRGDVIGRLVLSSEGTVPVVPPHSFSMNDNGLWLIAGGTRGFGLSIAEFLVSRGVRHLALVSRSGLSGENEKRQVQALREKGARVEIAALDICDGDALNALVSKLHRPERPLVAVIQSTLQLADGLLEQMDRAQMRVPMESKIHGTWNLHRATLAIPLKHFVCFSSISSLYGFPGQGNYAAANAFLDALAVYRRRLGLPASTVNWGALSGVGFVARSQKVADFLSSNGWESLRLGEAISAFERILLENPVNTGVFNADWTKVAQVFPANVNTARFASVHAAGGASAAEGADAPGDLAALDPAARTALIQSVIRQILSRVVGVPAEKVDVNTPVTRLGLDSLMANQVRSAITAKLNVEVSLMQIMQGPTIVALADELGAAIASANGSEGEEEARDPDHTAVWFPGRSGINRPVIRLFCLPYLGAGASIYSGWQEALGSSVEVCPIQLPGREERSQDPPVGDAGALLEAIATAMTPYLDEPFAIYGHSFGGNLAFSLASYLQGTRNARAAQVIVGAASPPGVPNPLEEEFKVTDATVAANLGEDEMHLLLTRIGASDRLLEDRELLQNRLGALRADLSITRQRLFPVDHVIGSPLTAIGGISDHLYNPEVIDQWRRHAGQFNHVSLPGGHLFLHEPESLRELFAVLSKVLLSSGAPSSDRIAG